MEAWKAKIAELSRPVAGTADVNGPPPTNVPGGSLRGRAEGKAQGRAPLRGHK